MLGRISRGGIGCSHDSRKRGSRSRMGDSRADDWLAGNPHAMALALELDFGEAGLLQQPSQFADQLLIDCRSLIAWIPHVRSPLFASALAALGVTRAANPAMASA